MIARKKRKKKMLVRKFTEDGHKEYASLIDDIFKSVETNNEDISKGYTS